MSTVAVGSTPLPVPKVRVSPFGREITDLSTRDARLAAKLAILDFLTPKRMLPGSRARAILDTAERSIHQVNGLFLKTYVWRNKKSSPYVFLGHGFMMNAASMLNFVHPLLRAGYSVVAWDQPGHGESGGALTFVQAWVDSFPTMSEHYAPLACVIGFSLSGTSALMAMAETPSFQCPGLVCLNSPRQVDTVLRGYMMKHGCPLDLMPLMHDAAVDEGLLLPRLDHEFMADAGGFPQSRCLIVQDQNDQVASLAEAEYWASMTRNAKLRMTSGLQHQGILVDNQLISRIVNYISREHSAGQECRARL